MNDGEILARFRARIGAVLTRDLQLDPAFAFDVSSAATEILEREGLAGLPDARAMLARWDIGHQWRSVLELERAQAVAEWIAPYTRGTVLDLFCASPTLGEALAQQGSPVVLAERDGAPLERDPRGDLSVIAVGPREGEVPPCDTVVLCDVLHREEDPSALLARVCAGGPSAPVQGAPPPATPPASSSDRPSAPRRRIIVVEPVMEFDTPIALARLLDAFVERVAWGGARPAGRHRAVEAWLAPDLMGMGRVAALERRDALPGVPMPHALIVADA